MGYMPTRECMGCGKTKECRIGEFGKAIGAKSAVRLSEFNYYTVWDKRVSCNLCDDCIGKTAPGTYNWPWWFLGVSSLLVFFGIYIWNTLKLPGGMPIGFVMVFMGWILGAIGAGSGLIKIGAGKVALFFSTLFAWTLIPALILFINYKRVKRAYWVNKQMIDKVNQIIIDTEKRNEQLMAEIANKAADELTAEEKKLLDEKQKNARRVEAEKEEFYQQAARKRYTGAVIGIAVTIVIAFIGFLTYNSGGYMTWLGIELPIGGFWALLGAFLVYDVLAIVFARRKIK